MSHSARRTVPVVLLVALMATLPSAATHTDEPPPLAPKTTARYQPMPQTNIVVPTRGGDVYVRLVRPNVGSQDVKVPVILTMTPYAALGASAASDGIWVRRGYARAVADVPGTGESGGCWDYGGARERQAAHDVVEWLGTQPWSNGKVGMIGASYDGTTANAAAVENPPHLATIVPEVAISDWYGYAYHDGVRYFVMDPAQRQGLAIDEQGFDTPAAFDFGYAIVPPRNREPAFQERLIERACPGMLDKLTHTARAYQTDPDFDAFWEERSYIRDAAVLADGSDGQETSVLVQGGWRDWNVKHSESVRWFEAIPADDPHTTSDEGVPFKMLVMGQADHGTPEGAFDWPTILHAWFDHFLYGLDTNIEDQRPVLSRTNDGAFHRDASWPPAGTGEVRLHLRRSGALTTEPPAAAEGSSTYADTARMTESAVLAARASGPEHLWFESAPLEQDLRISGLPQLDLFASTLGPSTHLTPVLFDLGPATAVDPSLCSFVPPQDACVVSRGFLNARYRDGLQQGRDLAPGEPYRARVRFIDNDYVVKAGHRIAVAVMSSNLWWALPDDGRAITTIAHDAERPSALILPILGGNAAATDAGL